MNFERVVFRKEVEFPGLVNNLLGLKFKIKIVEIVVIPIFPNVPDGEIKYGLLTCRMVIIQSENVF